MSSSSNPPPPETENKPLTAEQLELLRAIEEGPPQGLIEEVHRSHFDSQPPAHKHAHQPGCPCPFCYNDRLTKKLKEERKNEPFNEARFIATANAFWNQEDLPYTTERFIAEVEKGRKDFRGEFFGEVHLEALNLEVMRGFNFSSTYWDMCVWRRLKFESCLFEGAIFQYCISEDVTMEWCDSDCVYYNNCVIIRLKTDKALLRSARFENSERGAFGEPLFHNAEFKMTDVSGTDFSQIDRHRITLIDAPRTNGTIWRKIRIIDLDP